MSSLVKVCVAAFTAALFFGADSASAPPAKAQGYNMCPMAPSTSHRLCRCRRNFVRHVSYTYARLNDKGQCSPGYAKVGTQNLKGPRFTGPCRRAHYTCLKRGQPPIVR